MAKKKKVKIWATWPFGFICSECGHRIILCEDCGKYLCRCNDDDWYSLDNILLCKECWNS